MIKLKTKKLKVKKTDKKEDAIHFYDELKHLEFVEPKHDKKKKILCIILHENGTSTWLWKNKKTYRFSYNKCMYYPIPSGEYKTDNGTICIVFLEGISTPISHGNIDKEFKEVEIVNPTTQAKEKHKVALIKGLKFDGKLIDLLLNRDLFEEFTKKYLDVGGTITAILLIVVAVLGVVNIVLQVVI